MSAKLVARRTVFKNMITKVVQFSNNVPVETTLREIDVKLGELEKQYAQAFEVHMQVMELTGDEAAAFEEVEIEAIQNMYERAKSNLLDVQAELMPAAAVQAPALQPQAVGGQRSEIKLPFIKIAAFNGDYNAWQSFRDLFQSAIGDRRDLNGAQKLHYLKSFLEGEAAQLVRSYALTDGNYRVAWQALNTRYNNKRLLVNAQFQRLFGQQAVQGGSASKLRQLLDTTAECVAALRDQELPTGEWDAVIVFIVVQRLDAESHKQWEISLTDNELPSFAELVEFMERRCRSLEAIGGSDGGRIVAARPAQRTASKALVNHTNATAFDACSVCNQAHCVANCRRFLSWGVAERRDAVQTRRLCYVCLRRGHISSNCTQATCSICNQRHHDLLHLGGGSGGGSNGGGGNGNGRSGGGRSCGGSSNDCSSGGGSGGGGSSSSGSDGRGSGRNVNGCGNSGSSHATGPVEQSTSSAAAVQTNFALTRNVQVLLSTAWVTINDSAERIRVLVDQGSHACLMRESCVQRLGLQRKRVSVPIRGIGGAQVGTATSIVSVRIKSCIDNTLAFDVNALVMRSLTDCLPCNRVAVANRPNFVGLQLADPTYYEPGDVDMVLGADIYGSLLLDGVIVGSTEVGRVRPTAQNTALGWILSGPISTSVGASGVQANIMSLHLDSEFDLRKFWEIDEVGEACRLTQSEIECEEHFVRTHQRDDSGRYVVRLPFTTAPDAALGESRTAALRRLRHVQRRLADQPDLRNQYDDFMAEYSALGHMQLAEQPAKGVAYYLPHHCVIKESSTTTRLRVVFDASCKTTSGRSLNDVQYVGPRLQSELAALVTRFRRHAVVLTADIAKMYRQIRVHDDDVDYQRILWFGDNDGDVREWQLRTVTYGMAASPYLAVRALQQLARDEQQSFPRAAQTVLTDFYVDDMITGCDTSKEAVALYRDICALLARGGMEIRKWASNCEQTLCAIPEDLRNSAQPLHLDADSSVKTLGLYWYPALDCFKFKVTPPTCGDRVTKRTILSIVARLFDPLGLLAPTIVVAKIIIQRLWTLGITWEDDVPEPVRSTWQDYHRTLVALESLRFDRWIGMREGAHLQLHGFADASETAYGGVVYARCELQDGSVRLSLLTAKTKVAPLKQVTLPRLELCAAALLSKLLKNVMVTFGLPNADYIMWSDSQVALSWMRKEPRCWKTFVANRVAAIQELTTTDKWRYVRSADNPADCLSRGVMPGDLAGHPLWMTGPKWLAAAASEWPVTPMWADTNIDERPAAATVLATPACEGALLLERFSSLTRLQIVTARLCRFAHNCRVQERSRTYGHVTAMEMRDALLRWIRIVQASEFGDEIDRCRKRVGLQKSSKLVSLNPFVDEYNVLRVGGRLRHAAIPADAAHPAILPRESPLTGLIIDYAHKALMHGGAQLMLAYIRQRYWILGAKGLLRQHVHRCVTCFRQRPRSNMQQMGDLPEARVTPARAFTRSGVDYAGPMAYKSRAGRGVRVEKGYVALFVCLSTKAVHVEFVSDLTTDTFLAAFRRFVARRGRCSELLSDNGTNFVGAKRKLMSICHSKQHHEDVARVLAVDGTIWRTIPPRSPHFGGLWEAGVKSVKHHLRRVVGSQLLTYEEFSTVLAQIEAVLNSRPLCPLSDDPDDLDALTPGHFLIGGAPTAVPDLDVAEVPTNRLSRWQLTSQIVQHFWRRWHQEYLSTLQQRYKWATVADNVKVGQLVLVKDELMPPTKWRMARVVQAQPGDDGRVRVVKLKTATGETTRAIARICVLPITT